MYKGIIKRLLDFLIAFIGFIFISPLFIVVLIILLFSNKGKPFFTQSRPGKGERIFKIIKFKTMNDGKDADGNLLPYEQRVTALGKFLRKVSLDELPQLINVMKGDMSLIGPRPLLIDYLPLYSEGQKRRHEVRPGVTGWAQVNGRNAISWEEKFDYDVWYVDHVSPLIDFKILLLTIKKVVSQDGVNVKDNLNMTTFTGSHNNS